MSWVSHACSDIQGENGYICNDIKIITFQEIQNGVSKSFGIVFDVLTFKWRPSAINNGLTVVCLALMESFSAVLRYNHKATSPFAKLRQITRINQQSLDLWVLLLEWD